MTNKGTKSKKGEADIERTIPSTEARRSAITAIDVSRETAENPIFYLKGLVTLSYLKCGMCISATFHLFYGVVAS